MNCETIRDMLPDLASGTLDHATSSLLHAHIAGCAGCAAEWRIVQSVHGGAMAVPADLVAGIAAAVARRAGTTGTRRHVRHYAMAAAIAFTLFGGLLAVQQLGDRASMGNRADPIAAPAVGSAAFPVTTDPLVGNQSAVSELTEEQLEALLTEMDS